MTDKEFIDEGRFLQLRRKERRGMRKYIDAEQMKYQIRHQGVPDDYYDDEEREDIMCEMVDDLPDADVAEVIHGEWIYVDGDIGYNVYRCSKCGKVISLDEKEIYNYCPNCGAKMDGERKDEE